MKPKSPKSLELYDIMIKRGYPAEFCDQITKNLNTDWTAGRMMGYLSHYKKLPLEEIVDEMLAILSDRNRIMQKHEMEEIIHGIMTKYIVEESGDFRSGEEGVFNGEECIFMAPPARFVPQLMNELFGWMKKEKDQMHPLILSSVFHYEFVFIHPFTDGNGRMARLWHTAILAKWNPIFEYIPIESQIEKFQDDYYDAIAKCHVEGESTVFIEFMLTQIDNILEELLNQMTDSATDDAILDADGANHGADNMESRLLSGLKQNPYITQTDLAKELSLSRRTVQRIMKELMNDGKIKRVGSTRTGHWEIND